MNSKQSWFLSKELELSITKKYLKHNMFLRQLKKLLHKPFQLRKKALQFDMSQFNSICFIYLEKLFISQLEKKGQKNLRSRREE